MKIVTAALVLVLATACSSAPRRPDSGYDPVPDRNLFQRAEQVDGIEETDLRYSSSPGDRGYRGSLRLDPVLDEQESAEAVSSVYAILRQGRYQQSITLDVVQGRRVVQFLPGVPSTGTTAELEELYGPQPGDGKPPP